MNTNNTLLVIGENPLFSDRFCFAFDEKNSIHDVEDCHHHSFESHQQQEKPLKYHTKKVII